MQVIYDDGDKWTGEAVWIYVLPPHHPGITMKVPMGAPTMDGIPGMAPGGGVQMGTSFGPPVMGAPPGSSFGPPVMGGPPGSSFGPPVMGGPPGSSFGPPAGGMEVLTVVATVPGGQSMQLQGPAGPMNVTVPVGVQPGQEFQFQAPSAPTFGAPPVVMAQPIANHPQVVLAQPV